MLANAPTMSLSGVLFGVTFSQALALRALAFGPSSSAYKLVVTGQAEVVWNQSSEGCAEPVGGKKGENGDSVPTAWHNPHTNSSHLISATYRGTYASVGSTLGGQLRHDCRRRVHPGVVDSLAPVGPPAGPNCTGAVQPGTCARYDPSTFSNFQWMQSVRVYPDGSGFALVHNEMHGELSGNRTLCSHNGSPRPGDGGKSCILWSTVLGSTVDGGLSWQLAQKPLFTLPKKCELDIPLQGYGALGPPLYDAGFYYGHVSRYEPSPTSKAGVPSKGVCAWRTTTPHNAASYRGWNGSSWSTEWINPYSAAPGKLAPSERWRYTCASINTGGDGSTHPQPKKFASAGGGGSADWRPAGWPSHVMIGWPTGAHAVHANRFKQQTISYAFSPPSPAADSGSSDSPANNNNSYSNDPRFTTWEPAQCLAVQEWLDPRHFGAGWTMLYPTIIDHDSPFGLSGGSNNVETLADGLSYSLVGNSSLYLYFAVKAADGVGYTVRLPIAWIAAGAPEPPSPFPPPKPACGASEVDSVVVTGAGANSVNGVYRKTNRTTPAPGSEPAFELDAQHQLYSERGVWRLAFPGTGVYYVGSSSSGDLIPGEGGWIKGGLGQAPTPGSASCQ